MSHPLPVFGNREPLLWHAQCERGCPAFQDCGGSDTAPCGCHRHGAARYACHTCSINCRDRRPSPGAEFADFAEANLEDGLPLRELRIRVSAASLPVFVPLRMAELPLGHRIDVSVVAAGLRDLFSRHRVAAVRPSRYLQSADELWQHLRVPSQAVVIGVLNGHDNALESFWHSDRREHYAAYQATSLRLLTGPTYSINAESPSNPAYNNVTMARRHNRVVQELHDAGRVAVPNLYWRNDADRHRWVEFLRSADIEMVSRDFSRTKQWPPFQEHLAGLIEIVRLVDRPLHVIVTGIGVGKAHHVMKELNGVSASCTVVSADPIMEAMNGKALISNGADGFRSVTRPRSSKLELASANLSVFQDHLVQLCARNRESESLRNGTFLPLEGRGTGAVEGRQPCVGPPLAARPSVVSTTRETRNS
jgi:hypothetical protein